MNSTRTQPVSSWSRHTVALGLTALLVVHPALALREPMPGLAIAREVPPTLPDAPMPAAAEGFTIEILDGEGALNNIRQRTAREPIVQVEDKNHKPVAGALILFAINDGSGGAGATVNGALTAATRTGLDGKAQLFNLKPNNLPGDFTITVTATVGTVVLTAIIHQKNELGLAEQSSQSQPGTATSEVARHNHHYILKGSIIGGVAVTGLVLGLVLSQRNTGATITAGAGNVGAP